MSAQKEMIPKLLFSSYQSQNKKTALFTYYDRWGLKFEERIAPKIAYIAACHRNINLLRTTPERERERQDGWIQYIFSFKILIGIFWEK